MPRMSLADLAANKLCGLIQNGTLKAGCHINIDALSKEFSMSQTPIREALKKLIAEGMAVYVPKVGYSVRNLTLYEYLQVLEILQMTETYLVRELAKTPFELDVKALRKINRELSRVVPKNDIAAIGEINDRFHQKLYENYHNRLLVHRLFELWSQMCVTRNQMYKNTAFSFKLESEHEAIISAVSSGSPEAAEAAMKEHYACGRDSAVASFPITAADEVKY